MSDSLIHLENANAAAHDIVMAADLVLIDLDGCLAFGGKPHPAAGALIRQLGSRYAILSNNSTQTPASLAKDLKTHGLIVDPTRIILAGTLMIDMLAIKHHQRRIALFAAEEINAYATRRGLMLSHQGHADVVALARDTAFTYAKLMRGVALLSSGASLVASNPDLTHPGEDGVPIPETGALLRLLQACIPNVVPEIIGKPSAFMFTTALARFGGAAETTVMIGDNPLTDGIGAERAGIRSLLVGPNNHYDSISAFLK